MRVAFDLAELGPYSYTGNGGVRRSIERISAKLMLRNGIDVTFTGISLSNGAEATTGFYKRVVPPGSCLFRHSGWLAKRAADACESITSKSLFARGVRRSLAAVCAACQDVTLRIPQSILRKTQVFHSPFRPIPYKVNVYRQIAKVLTIYDLIPIRNRDLVSPHFVTSIKQILASIRPDTWIICISQWVKDDFCEFTGHPPEQVVVA